MQAAPKRTHLVLAALVLALPLVTAAVSLGLGAPDQQTLIGDSAAMTLCVLAVSCLAIFLAIEWAIRRQRLTIGPEGLHVTTSFYRRQLSLAQLHIDQARVVDLSERTELKPMLKTNGTRLPGFSSGWFRLRNRGKALVAISGGPRVLWLPTTQGYDLLLQPVRPQALLDRLKELAPTSARG